MRRKQKYKKEIEPDLEYNSPVVAKFVNVIMKDGKKTVAEKVVYGALSIIKEETQKEPLEIFDNAIKNISPLVELKSKRVGGANYQVPREVRGPRKLALAFRWIITASRSEKESRWPKNWPKNFCSRLKTKARLSRKNKMCTGWLKPIKPSLISVGKNNSYKVHKVQECREATQ